VQKSSTGLRIMMLRISLVVLIVAALSGVASGDDSPTYVLTQDMLNKTLGVLTDLRNKNLPFKIGDGDLDTEIANLEKDPKVARVLKKHGLSPREFILTYKATKQIREAQKAQDDWQKILQDPDASPEAKLDATQKLAESLKNNLFTPEQLELVRRRIPDIEAMLTPPK
jgi:hypothetical protein